MARNNHQTFLEEFKNAINPHQASKMADIDYKKILRDIKEGVLPAYKPGKEYKILPRDFAVYLKKTKVSIDLTTGSRTASNLGRKGCLSNRL